MSKAIILSERELDFLGRVLGGKQLRHANREEDKARQRMRRLGFAEVVMSPRRWILTDAGRAAISVSP